MSGRPEPGSGGNAPRIAVIGAGAVGAAVAYRLAGKGVEILLLDGGQPGEGATAASFGAVNARFARNRAQFDLCQAAMEEHHRLAWSLAPAFWRHASGALVWSTRQRRAAMVQRQAVRLQRWGYPAEILTAADVRRDLAPGMAAVPPDTPVYVYPEEAWVDGPEMTRRLVDAARNAGARILTGPERSVTAIGRDGGRVASLTLAGGQTLPVSAVVNAAGGEAEMIAAMVGRSLTLTHAPGLVVELDLPAPVGHPDWTVEPDGVLMRPDGPERQRLGSPPGSKPPASATGDVSRWARMLVAHAVRAFPELAGATVAAERPGDWFDSVPPFASVGPVAAIPGYWEAVARPGLTLAPLIGRSLATELLGGAPDARLARFRPESA